MNSKELLQQIPVVPQVSGRPKSYPLDKVPKGATIAFMPVIILPEAGTCDQPSALGNFNSLFSGVGALSKSKDQCTCPCPCSQKLKRAAHHHLGHHEDEKYEEGVEEQKVEEKSEEKLIQMDEKNNE